MIIKKIYDEFLFFLASFCFVFNYSKSRQLIIQYKNDCCHYYQVNIFAIKSPNIKIEFLIVGSLAFILFVGKNNSIELLCNLLIQLLILKMFVQL